MELHKVMEELITQHRFSKRQICESLGVTRVTLLVPPEASEIIQKYAGRDLLLNFMETRRDYNQFLRRINMHLKRTGEALQLSKKLTTYCARHSWATTASGLGISQDVIRAALGHGMNTITDIYIDFDLRRVDEANRAVIDYVKTIHNLG